MEQITIQKLKELAEQAKANIESLAASMSRPVRIFLHWSAGHYDQAFDDYHLCINKDGALIATTDDLSAVLAHTWRNNDFFNFLLFVPALYNFVAAYLADAFDLLQAMRRGFNDFKYISAKVRDQALPIYRADTFD